MINRLGAYFAGLARPVMVAFGVTAMFAVIAARGGHIALSGPSDASGTVATAIRDDVVKRGDIFDRNGELLATSVDVYSLSANPSEIWDADEVVSALASVIEGLNEEVVANRLSQRNKKFVWVRRGLTPRQRQAVFELGLEGLRFSVESKRVYPHRSQSGHVLGHTNIDGIGQMGVERIRNDLLTSGEGSVQLTIDSGVQFVLETELAAAAERFQVDMLKPPTQKDSIAP